jgi:hypothetical protein
MPSKTTSRHQEIANALGEGARLAMETVEEIRMYREALFRCAPLHQAHAQSGTAIADALDIAFPIRMEELEAAAKDDGMNPELLWPWVDRQWAEWVKKHAG